MILQEQIRLLSKYCNHIPKASYEFAIENMKYENKPKRMNRKTFLGKRKNEQIEYIVNSGDIQLEFMKQIRKCYEEEYNKLNINDSKNPKDYIDTINNSPELIDVILPFFMEYNFYEFLNFISSIEFKKSDVESNTINKNECVDTYREEEKSMTENNDSNMNNSKKIMFYLGCVNTQYDDNVFIVNPMVSIQGDEIKSTDEDTLKITFTKKLTPKEAYKCYFGTVNEDDIYRGNEKPQIYEKNILPLVSLSSENVYEILSTYEIDDMDNYRSKKPYEYGIYNSPVSDKIFIQVHEYLYGPFKWTPSSIDNNKIIIVPDSKDISNPNIIKKIKKSDCSKSIFNQSLIKDKNRSETFIYLNSIKAEKIIPYDFIDNETLKTIVSQNITSPDFTRQQKQELQAKIKGLDDNVLSEERKKRILDISENSWLNNNIATDVFKRLLSNEYFWSKDSNIPSQFAQYLENNKEQKKRFIESLDKKSNIIKSIKEEEQKLNKIAEDKKKLSVEIEELKKAKSNIEHAKVTEQMQEEKEQMQEERDNLEQQIKELSGKLKLGNDIIEWENKKADAKLDYSSTRKVYDDLKEKEKAGYEEQKASMEKTIDELTRNAETKLAQAYQNVAINDVFSNMIVNSAAKFAGENSTNDSLKSPSVDDSKDFDTATDFTDFIQYKLKRYTQNDIVNIFLCVSQGFLTVFAGKPGTGKTSLCERIAKICGLDKNDASLSRFAEVSVEKGWSSKRDFIGYYNPISKTFDRVNSNVYPALKLLDQEQKDNISDFPYFILLDEANLSPMEHYWAEFMNVCDFDNNRKIEVGENESYMIADTLRFLATINYDTTTETLSPRLLDRAWIIDLDSEIDYDEIVDEEIQCSEEIVSFEVLKKFFGANMAFTSAMNDSISPDIKAQLEKIYESCKPYMSISPRVRKAISKYYYVATENKLFDSDNISIALDYAVSQKILPLIDGYGEEYKEEFLVKLNETCSNNSMTKCCDILRQIISTGDKNMNYYNYFNR